MPLSVRSRDPKRSKSNADRQGKKSKELTPSTLATRLHALHSISLAATSGCSAQAKRQGNKKREGRGGAAAPTCVQRGTRASCWTATPPASHARRVPIFSIFYYRNPDILRLHICHILQLAVLPKKHYAIRNAASCLLLNTARVKTRRKEPYGEREVRAATIRHPCKLLT